MANADVVWIDVLPNLRQWPSAVRKELQGVMPAAGRQAGEEYARGFGQAAVSGIQRASAQVAAARKKEADAAGAVRVAEARLDDLRASGRAKTGQLVAAEEGLARARRTLDLQTDTVVRSTRALADAQEQEARAARQSAAGLGQANQQGGLVARTFGNMRNAVATGIAAFYAVQGAVRFLGNATRAASDLSQAVSTSSVIFGDNADKIDKWARGAAQSVGLSRRAATEAAVVFGDMFQQLGFAQDAATDMSISTVQLAADLGAFRNLPTGDVVQRITAAFRGEYDSLQLLIPNINAARVEQEAMAATGKKNADQLTAQEKAAATLAIVQKDGARAMGAFARESDGLTGSQQRLSAAWENAQARLGELLTGPMTDGLRFVENGLLPAFEAGVTVIGAVGHVIGSLPAPVQAAAGALLLLRVGMALLNGPLSGVRDGFIRTGTTIKLQMTTAAQTAATSGGVIAAAGTVARAGWAGFMALLGGPVGLAIAGVTLAFSLLSSETEDNTEATDAAAMSQSELAQALMQSKGAIDANVRAAAAKEAQDRGILDVAERLGIPLSQVTDAILGQGTALQEVGAELVRYRDARVLGGEADQRAAAQANAAWSQLQQLSGQSDVNIQKAQQLAQATTQSGDAADAATGQTADLTTQLEGAQKAANDARQATDLLKLSLDILTGQQVSLIQVESAYQEALAKADGALENLTGSVLQANGQLNLQSEAGRAASDVLLDVRDSGNQLIATMIQQGATSDQAVAKDRQLRESFIRSATQMGISREAAEKLADQILGIPAQRETQIRADTRQATAAAAEVQRQINALKGREVVIAARTAISASLSGVGGGPLPFGGHAEGGYTGPGAKHEPAGIVHRGEIVFSQADVAAHGGVAAVESLRRSRRRGYADGGVVQPSGVPIAVSLRFDPARYNAEMDAAASRLAKSLEPAGRMVAALSWAKTQVGKPYIWGGVGPGGYDCSGFMSAITNVIRGRSPYTRLGSTATFPWPGFGGGYGAFTIGSTPNVRGSGIGHMAGTVLGVNVESTGGVGPRVGAAARGASDGLFTTRAHLLDDGGLWPPGWGLNATGGVERVLTPPQDTYFRRLIDATERAEHQPTEVNGIKDSVINVTNLDELMREQRRAARRAMAAAGLS